MILINYIKYMSGDDFDFKYLRIAKTLFLQVVRKFSHTLPQNQKEKINYTHKRYLKTYKYHFKE